MRVICVSGGFDPPHVGHLRMFDEARSLGDKLVVILNNDEWLKKKKGYVFMSQEERAELIRGFRSVDEVIISEHCPDCTDMSVCKELSKLNPDVFANGGDRKQDNIPEYSLCERLGIVMVFGVGGGKAQSSSELVKKASEVLR